MSDHRQYLEYLISQDPRGNIDHILEVRKRYRREGASALPVVEKPPARLPEDIVSSPSNPALPPPLPPQNTPPSNSLQEELDQLAEDIVTSDDLEMLRAQIGDKMGRGLLPENQRLNRFRYYLSNRERLRKIAQQHPDWRPMLRELEHIWLAPINDQQEQAREDLIKRRLHILPPSGISDLVAELRTSVPELVKLENELLVKLVNPRTRAIEPRNESQAPRLPNLHSSSGREESGGFRWTYLILGWIVIKIIIFLVRSITE